MRLNNSFQSGSTERLTLVTRLLSSGRFQTNDKNALWLLSIKTLQKLADGLEAPEEELDPEDLAPAPNRRLRDIGFQHDDQARHMLAIRPAQVALLIRASPVYRPAATER